MNEYRDQQNGAEQQEHVGEVGSSIVRSKQHHNEEKDGVETAGRKRRRIVRTHENLSVHNRSKG